MLIDFQNVFTDRFKWTDSLLNMQQNRH